MEQPTIQDKQELQSIDFNGYDLVTIPGTKTNYKIGWIKNYTLEQIDKLSLKLKEHKDKSLPYKYSAQMASLCILNGMKIFFFHSLLWRYLYYVKGYTSEQLVPIIQTAKKKAPVEGHLIITMLSETMTLTTMTVTEEEAK